MVKSDQTQEAGLTVAGRTTLIRRLLLVAGLLVVVSGTLVFPFPMKGRLWANLFDLAHAPVFFVALLCFVGMFDPSAVGMPAKYKTVVPMTFRRVLLVAGVLMTVGILCEYLQKFAARSPSFGDVLANSSGILAAVFWIWSRRLQGVVRNLVVLAAMSVLIAVSVPTVFQLWDCAQQIRSFPVIGSFERPLELDG